MAEDYQQPYFEYVTHDPTVLEMKQVVVDEKKRPSFEKSWKDNEVGLLVPYILLGIQ